MNYTYILECADGTYYTGWTNNLVKRIQAHNSGKGAKYTKTRIPVRLRYFEEFQTKEDAMRREYVIKHMTRKEKERIIMKKSSMPAMKTHLDFHTSPDILGVGSRFSKGNFQKALQLGNLESITVFAKCHHGVCYYPTEIGTTHPGLSFDLLGAMIEAAHEIGVKAPIYITAGWSHEDSIKHPEWRAVKQDGTYHNMGPYNDDASPGDSKTHCTWQTLCLNDGEYAQHIYDITEEICKKYPVDGLFYDICFLGNGVCYCEECKKGMREMGMNPEIESDVRKYYILKRQAFMQKCIDIMHKYNPNGTIFFNSGGADIDKPEFHDYQSHFEMEDLPTAWGGYDKLPLRAKYFMNKGKETIGMTGKFHLDWGEFGGFKPKEALKFEIASMALYGVGASVGDHMHPDGEMELQTYENIGYAYGYLKEITPYCFGGKSTADLGLYLSPNDEVNEGVSNILVQNQIDYGVIAKDEFALYDTVIIPNGTVMSDTTRSSLETYMANGGKILLMGDALVKDGAFQLDTGLQYEGPAEYDCDYLLSSKLKEDIPNAPLLCNVPGHRVNATGAEVVAEFITPYFSRTYGRFCGHKNTPYNKESKRYPAIVKLGNVVYVSHPLSLEYFAYGSIYHRNYFMHALKLIYAGGRLTTEGLGSQGRCRMIRQEEENRYCINVVYGSSIRRGRAEIIEDITPIYGAKFSVKTEKNVKRVYLPLTGEELDFEQKDGMVHFTVPKFQCHVTIVLEY